MISRFFEVTVKIVIGSHYWRANSKQLELILIATRVDIDINLMNLWINFWKYLFSFSVLEEHMYVVYVHTVLHTVLHSAYIHINELMNDFCCSNHLFVVMAVSFNECLN